MTGEGAGQQDGLALQQFFSFGVHFLAVKGRKINTSTMPAISSTGRVSRVLGGVCVVRTESEVEGEVRPIRLRKMCVREAAGYLRAFTGL